MTVNNNVVSVIRSISLDPKSGSSTADVTVTGKGFSTGSATVFIDKTPDATTEDDTTDGTFDPDGMFDSDVDTVISSGRDITDGSFTVVIPGIANPTGESKVTINAFDGAGLDADKGAEYTFGAGLSVSPDSISWGQTLTLTITDNTMVPTRVRFAGSNTHLVPVETTPAATAKEAKVEVPSGVPVGTQKVEVLDAGGVITGLSSTVKIDPSVRDRVAD